jgi:hypothetical protein
MVALSNMVVAALDMAELLERERDVNAWTSELAARVRRLRVHRRRRLQRTRRRIVAVALIIAAVAAVLALT